jgi:hypothetical protein
MFSNNPKHGPKTKNQPEIQKLFKVIYIFSDNLKVKKHLIKLFSSNRTLDTKNNHFGGYDN